MNVKDGLLDIRARLIANGALPETVKMVDTIIQRAALPAASGAQTPGLLQLVRMLMRNPVSNGNPMVYNDLVKVEAELEERAAEYRRLRDEECRMANPKDPGNAKSTKFYKKGQ